MVGYKLTRIGFDVLTSENVNSPRFASATRDFAERAKGTDIALFYYAGRAIQADGEYFLMPVDNGKMRSIDDMRDQGSVQLADTKQVPQGGLIAFATSPGSTAEDGTARNSIFSKHFAAQLSVPNQII